MVTGVPMLIACSLLVRLLEQFNFEISTHPCRKSPIDAVLFCFYPLCSPASSHFVSLSITRYHRKKGRENSSRGRERERRAERSHCPDILLLRRCLTTAFSQNNSRCRCHWRWDASSQRRDKQRFFLSLNCTLEYDFLSLSLSPSISLSVSLALSLWCSRTYLLLFQRWSLFDVELRQSFYIYWSSLGLLSSFGIFFLLLRLRLLLLLLLFLRASHRTISSIFRIKLDPHHSSIHIDWIRC